MRASIHHTDDRYFSATGLTSIRWAGITDYNDLPKLADIKARIRDNGLRWSAHYFAGAFFRKLADASDRQLAGLEEQRDLPGINHIHGNRRKWQEYDWSEQGEEWTPSEAWKQSLVQFVMNEYVPTGSDVLEIGPGAGRWTSYLQERAKLLRLIDLSESCIEACRRRFRDADNIQFHLGDGRSLSPLAADSVDRVWSFDVFVHISVPDTRAYIAEIGRVMRPGGLAVIHHPKEGGGAAGYRSRMDAKKFADAVESSGLAVRRQFNCWGPDGLHDVRHFGDVITVFSKPVHRDATSN